VHEIKEYPFISIIVPAKNEQKYISRCLESLDKLNYPKEKLEIIVVDNNSTDQTRDIASGHENSKLLVADGTISSVRNFGGKQAKGDLLAFLDSDCIPTTDWLLKAVSTLNKGAEIAVVGAVLELEDLKKSPWIETYWLNYLNLKFQKGINYVATISSFCFVVKKNVMEEVDWFNEDLATCEDSDLGYRISQAGYKLVINEDIKTVHLRNAKTSKEFFDRQLWQGGSNLKNFFQHDFEWSELPSVAVPFVYLVMLLLFVFAILSPYPAAKYYAFLVLAFLPVAITLRSDVKLTYKNVVGYSYIWFLYLLGRGLGMAIKIGRRSK